jgi:hypothetical protein
MAHFVSRRSVESSAALQMAIGWYLANLLFGGISTTTDTSGIF